MITEGQIVNDFAKANKENGLYWMLLAYCDYRKGLKAVARVSNSRQKLLSSLRKQFPGGVYINHRGIDRND